MAGRSSAVVVLVATLLWACGGGPGGGGESTEAAGGGEASAADSVVGAWIRAAGGASAWDSVRTLRYTVTTVWYDSAGRVERMRPRRVGLKKTETGFMGRIERPESEGLYVQGFTGDTLWATLNGHPLPADHPAVREAEYVNRDVFYWIGLPWKLRDPGVNLRARRLDGGGHEVAVTFGTGVGQHSGDRYFYLFTDADPFPEEVHYIEEGAEERTRTLWRDFGTTPPLTYVGTRRYVDDRGVPTMELRIDDVVTSPSLPDSLFLPPPTGRNAGGGEAAASDGGGRSA